jgi:FMN reductase
MQIIIVSGNPRRQSRTSHVAQELAQLVGTRTGLPIGQHLELIDIAGEIFDPDSVRVADAVRAVKAAAILIIASPTYKGTYTGLLKSFLDRLPPTGLADVVAVPVMTGAAHTHALSIDHSMRPLLVELGASVPTRGIFVAEKSLADFQDLADDWAATQMRLLTGCLKPRTESE